MVTNSSSPISAANRHAPTPLAPSTSLARALRMVQLIHLRVRRFLRWYPFSNITQERFDKRPVLPITRCKWKIRGRENVRLQNLGIRWTPTVTGECALVIQECGAVVIREVNFRDCRVDGGSDRQPVLGSFLVIENRGIERTNLLISCCNFTHWSTLFHFYGCQTVIHSCSFDSASSAIVFRFQDCSTVVDNSQFSLPSR